MKKILLFAAIIVSVNLAGQDFRFGINFDPVVSWISPDSKLIEYDGSKLGFNTGLMLETYFRKNYAFATGINLTYMGGNLKYADTVNIETESGPVVVPANVPVGYTIQYISVPLSLKMKSNPIGYISYYGQVGLTPHFNIKSKASGGDLNKDNVNEEISLFNLSYFIGGGIEYSLGGTTAINLGIFFNNGFIDLLEKKGTDYRASIYFFNLRLGILF
ncbi:MAG: PorT family protein [Bacteroidales bacterium]|nr:PorT family protein [Bacteroidales bacterium]